MGWLKLCLEAVGVVIRLGCFLDWILAPLLMWPLVQKRHEGEEDLEDSETEGEVQKVWFCLVKLPINK